MLQVTPSIAIPESELEWSFVRSGGPGGQNVNKVASRAVLRWHLADTRSLPEDVKARLQFQQRGRITQEGDLLISSQRFRDQGRNVEDCLSKLREAVLQATHRPKARKRTRPSRASKERRLEEKHRRTSVKRGRRGPGVE